MLHGGRREERRGKRVRRREISFHGAGWVDSQRRSF
jgi:hypothetical protein